MTKLRVLQVFPYRLAPHDAGSSGVFSVIRSIVRSTADDVDHIVLTASGSGFDDELREAGADVVSLNRSDHVILRRGSSPTALLRHASELAVDVPHVVRLIRNRHIDLVHSHGSAYLGAAFAGRLARRPVLIHVHERSDLLPPLLASAHRRLVARTATRVIVIADFMRRDWEGAGASVVNLPNTVADNIGGRPSDEPVIGFLGRVAPRKGIEHALQALPGIIDACPGARLVVVGGPSEPEDYPYFRRLHDIARELAIEENVTFAGPTRDRAAALGAFRVLAFTSPIDIAPVTVLEAMSFGLPVVSASDGGAEEMIVDGETGFTVAPRNSVDLGERLARVLRDPSLHERLSHGAKERFQTHYGPELYRRRLLELYDAVIERTR